LLWRRQRRWAVALPVLMAGAGALQAIAKWSIHRARPDESPWGFPSGHVLSLVVFFGLMIWLVVTASKRRRRWRLVASALCALTVAVVAFSRLYLDRHWLSDRRRAHDRARLPVAGDLGDRGGNRRSNHSSAR